MIVAPYPTETLLPTDRVEDIDPTARQIFQLVGDVYPEDTYERAVTRLGDLFFTMEQDGEVLGIAGMSWEPPHRQHPRDAAWLDIVAVRPDLRGTGRHLGPNLLERVESVSRSTGYTSLGLACANDRRVYNFWRDHGFATLQPQPPAALRINPVMYKFL